MSWNARVRCIDDRGREHTKGKIYNVKNGKIKDDDGMPCMREYRNIDELNEGFDSKFELVEDGSVDVFSLKNFAKKEQQRFIENNIAKEKTCNNCANKTLSDKTESCNKCLSGRLPDGEMSPPSHWTPKDAADNNVGNMAKSTDNKQVYWNNICKMQQRQTEKGLSKYGQILEDNIKMDMKTRLEYLQEELIDGLMYVEHIKSLLGIGGIES